MLLCNRYLRRRLKRMILELHFYKTSVYPSHYMPPGVRNMNGPVKIRAGFRCVLLFPAQPARWGHESIAKLRRASSGRVVRERGYRSSVDII